MPNQSVPGRVERPCLLLNLKRQAAIGQIEVKTPKIQARRINLNTLLTQSDRKFFVVEGLAAFFPRRNDKNVLTAVSGQIFALPETVSITGPGRTYPSLVHPRHSATRIVCLSSRFPDKRDLIRINLLGRNRCDAARRNESKQRDQNGTSERTI